MPIDKNLSSNIIDEATGFKDVLSQELANATALYNDLCVLVSSVFLDLQVSADFVSWDGSSAVCRSLEGLLPLKYSGNRLGYLRASSPTYGFFSFCVFYVDYVVDNNGSRRAVLRRVEITKAGPGFSSDVETTSYSGQAKQVVHFAILSGLGFIPALELP